jgi:hypothetical protein
MRRKRIVLWLAGFAAAMALVVFAAETLVIKVQTTQLRGKPQFFAPGVAALKAGDKLTKVAEASGWMQVRTAAGAAGWVHGSAVAPPGSQVFAGAGDMKTQATANEVVLAGKGFNKQIEDNYRAKNAGVSYAWVDRMVQQRVAMAQIEDFLKRGRLAGAGGPR